MQGHCDIDYSICVHGVEIGDGARCVCLAALRRQEKRLLIPVHAYNMSRNNYAVNRMTSINRFLKRVINSWLTYNDPFIAALRPIDISWQEKL